MELLEVIYVWLVFVYKINTEKIAYHIIYSSLYSDLYHTWYSGFYKQIH